MYPQGDVALHFRTREQRVKTVNFVVCKNPPKLIGYHCNVPRTSVKLVSFVIHIHTSTKPERLVKMVSVVVEIFIEIGRFLPYHFKSTNFSHLNLWHYWTKVHDICTRCRGIICAIKLLIHTAIFYSVSKMPGWWMKVISPIWPKIGCHGNVPREIGKKLVWIDNIHTNTFHLVKNRENLSSIFWDSFAQLKKKRKVKYIARSAASPSGLKKK